MLLLPFQLFAVLLPGADSEDGFQGPTSYHVIQISSFANSTWAQNQCSGWLEDLQIHGWDSKSGTAIYLKPWSKGNLTDKELAYKEEMFRVYLFRFIKQIQALAKIYHMKYPFQFQVIAGCELRPGGSIVSFLRKALGGLDFLRFDNDTCVPSPEWGHLAQQVCALVTALRGFIAAERQFLYEICPRFLLGILDEGKAELQRKVKPEAWLSSGPSPGPGRLLLVCHVSGFYPKPVWVMWMRGEQEQPGTQHSDLLPSANWTWYLQATLDVASEEAAGLSCRVKHSSLEGQDIILHWGQPISITSICLAVIVPTLILLLCLALWHMRHQ
ncbi:T-cell surface glycoprotein CD1b-like [Otolemur garnettii]|uniref:T-cell surface glycoprotein CD1b-like n=1 Tax=Otolemur garnettii TaxID=30611 RepID=UPI0006440E77|nr:T-cell surface glycoprotein CD1b-like [Otolemur garnettii]